MRTLVAAVLLAISVSVLDADVLDLRYFVSDPFVERQGDIDAPFAYVLVQNATGDTIGAAPEGSTFCEPNKQEEIQPTVACGFNDAAVPNLGIFSCHNYFETISKSCKRTCFFQICKE